MNESEETKKMRERLKLKKEKRELYKITGRKMESEIPGDQTLKTFESSMKFAMSYLFALFTSGLGGYFAAKVFFGFDYAAVNPKSDSVFACRRHSDVSDNYD